jgi:hypothetical protein
LADATISIEGLLATSDGRSVVRTTDNDADPAVAGRRVAATLQAMFGPGTFDAGVPDPAGLGAGSSAGAS